MKKKNIRVAIVTKPIEFKGGAEKTLIHLLNEFPQAHVFTVRSNREFIKKELKGIKVRNSFIHYLPFEKLFRKELFLLYPLAYRSFSYINYDVVISICDSFPKYTHPWRKHTKHIAYILTPPKFLWMHEQRSIKENNRITYKIYNKFIGTFLENIWKKWDTNALKKADKVIAISEEIRKRIKNFYNLESEVIYPPVEVKDIKLNKDQYTRENWFLYLGRVETYKGVELAIRSCVIAKKPLKVAGTGAHLENMKRLVTELNAKGIVKFLGYYEEDEKVRLLQRCKALLFPVRSEDFGIVPVEANAAGCPVIAFKEGGVLESISDENPKTGVFFEEYTPESLAKAISEFDPDLYDPSNCRKQASQFAGEIFQYKMRNLVNEITKSN